MNNACRRKRFRLTHCSQACATPRRLNSTRPGLAGDPQHSRPQWFSQQALVGLAFSPADRHAAQLKRGQPPPDEAGRRGQAMRERMAGAPGFEPGNVGTKNRCLTAWRRPSRRGIPAARGLIGRGGAKLNAGRSTKICGDAGRQLGQSSPDRRRWFASRMHRRGSFPGVLAKEQFSSGFREEGEGSLPTLGPHVRGNPAGRPRAYLRTGARAPSRAGSGRGSHRRRCMADRSVAAAEDPAP